MFSEIKIKMECNKLKKKAIYMYILYILIKSYMYVYILIKSQQSAYASYTSYTSYNHGFLESRLI